MKKRTVLLLVMMVVCLMISGCGSNNNEQGDSETEQTYFVIGASGPLTGGAAEYGVAVKTGAEIAVKEINEKAGKEVLKLEFEDDKHDGELAVNAYATLKDKGMQVSLLCVTTGPCLAVAADENADGYFAITPSGSADDIVNTGDGIFRMCFGDPEQGVAAANYMKANMTDKKIAIIYKQDDEYSSGIYATFKQTAASLGLNVVTESNFTDETASEFSTQVKDAKDNGAEIIFLPIYYGPASLIIKEANSENYSPIFFGVDGMDGILSIDGFDKSLAEGVYLLTPFTASATDDATVSFVKQFVDIVGYEPNQFAADGYDSVYLIWNGLQATNATPSMSAKEIGDLLKEYAKTATFSGLTGENMTWAANGAVVKAPRTYKVQNGTYVSAD